MINKFQRIYLLLIQIRILQFNKVINILNHNYKMFCYKETNLIKAEWIF